MTFLINFMIYIENISVINSNIDLRPTSMLGCVIFTVCWSVLTVLAMLAYVKSKLLAYVG